MIFSNFQLLATTKNNVGQDVFHAIIDIETGRFFWKKKKTVPMRKVYADHWWFVNSDEIAPDDTINRLALSWAVENDDNSQCHFQSW
jgi:hypothetical protein